MNNDWCIFGDRVIHPVPFCIVGILNLTPDSFSDGQGQIPSAAASLERCRRMLGAIEAYGCGILDLGAESTRAGACPVLQHEESERLCAVLEPLVAERPDGVYSVDTYRSSTAMAALERGCSIINDVSACTLDPQLVDVLVQYRPGYVLTHGGAEHFSGTGRTRIPSSPHKTFPAEIDGLLRFFERKLTQLVQAGLPENRIVLDPGIGFGKTGEANWTILRHIDTLHRLGRPLYVGLSRKSLFGHLLGLPVEQRETPTQVSVALLASRGVAYHRIHDVEVTAHTLRIVQAMREDRSCRQ